MSVEDLKKKSKKHRGNIRSAIEKRQAAINDCDMERLAPGEHEAYLNRVRVHYTIRGAGPALIAIYGGPGMDARGFEGLAGLENYLTLVIPHPRCSGLSGPAPGDTGYTLPDYAADIEALRAYLGLKKPIVLGWSHGGMIAQQFALTYPGSLSKLILLSTTAYFSPGDLSSSIEKYSDRPWFADSVAAMQQAFGGAYASDEELTRLWYRAIRFYFYEYDDKAEAYCQRSKSLLLCRAPFKAFNEGEAATLDMRSDLRKIQVPTLVIVGKGDIILPTSLSREIVRHIPGARLELFENSGHFTFVEEPEKLNRTIREFVAE